MIKCLYNKYFFEQLYKFMCSRDLNTAIDSGDTLWHIKDIENILVKEFGWHKSQNGSIF